MTHKASTDKQRGRGRPSPTAPESRSLSAAVWGHLESIPGFNEDLRKAEADVEAGRGIVLEDDERPRPPQPPR